MEKTKKKSFIFNIEWHEILSDFPAEVRLEVYDAIIEYVASGTLSELKPLAKIAFSFIKKEIDYNFSKYDDMVEKRREAGRKGGNPNFKRGKSNPYYDNQEISKDNQEISKDNQEISKDNQTLPKITIYDNDNENDNKETSLTRGKENGAATATPSCASDEAQAAEPKTERLPAEEIKAMWNATCTSFPKLFTLSDNRKNKMRLRIEEIGGAEKALPLLRIIFEKMQASSFLKGENKRGWKASFDWVFENGKNWVKVWEGNYDNLQNEVPADIGIVLRDNSTEKYHKDSDQWNR